MSDWRNPQIMKLADLVENVRDRLKRRRTNLDPIYYTLHDAAVDEALLEEVGLLRLRVVESSGSQLADATPKSNPRGQ